MDTAKVRARATGTMCADIAMRAIDALPSPPMARTANLRSKDFGIGRVKRTARDEEFVLSGEQQAVRVP